jgi:hypothetical protein
LWSLFVLTVAFLFVSDAGELVLWRLFQAGDLHLGMGVAYKGKLDILFQAREKEITVLILYQCCGSGIPDPGSNQNKKRREK